MALHEGEVSDLRRWLRRWRRQRYRFT